jgi:hypothetical protein
MKNSPYPQLSYTLHYREMNGDVAHQEHIETATDLHQKAQEHISKGRIVLGYSINEAVSPISERVIPPTGIRALLRAETE